MKGAVSCQLLAVLMILVPEVTVVKWRNYAKKKAKLNNFNCRNAIATGKKRRNFVNMKMHKVKTKESVGN